MSTLRLRSAALVMGISVMLGLSAPPAGGALRAPRPSGGVAIAGFTYHPREVLAFPGERIGVLNVDGTTIGIPHSLSADNGSFDTGIFRRGVRGIRAPARPGRFGFHCNVHSFMHGTMVVVPRPVGS